MSDINKKIDSLIEQFDIAMQESNQTKELFEDIDKRIGEIKEDVLEQENKHLRLYAEFENYKKRSIKEKSDIINTASEKMIVEFLPIVDDLERALEHMDDSSKQGTEMILNKFKNIMESNNVVRMNPVGTDFNPEFHQALTTVPNPEMSGKVVDVITPGYVLGEKVIRFATVVVGE